MSRGGLFKSITDVVNTTTTSIAKHIADTSATVVSPFAGRQFTFGTITVRVRSEIAEGGYSFVYLARDVATNKGYALKRMVCQNSEMLELARLEVKVLRELPPHKNVIRFFGAEEIREGGTVEVFILLELCTGGHLVDLLQKMNRRPIPEKDVWRIFEDCCASVVHLHSQNPPIVHRDLKIENVLLNEEEGRYKLCDFGSCTTRKMTPESRRDILEIEEEVQRMTTLAYRSPEMVDLYRQQTIHTKADVWALGCILYRLAFTDHPFEDGANLQIINGVYSIPSRSPYSHALHEMIRFCLNADPEERPSSSTVLDFVRQIRDGRVQEARDGMGQKHSSRPELPKRDAQTRDQSGSITKKYTLRGVAHTSGTAPVAQQPRQQEQQQQQRPQQRPPQQPPRMVTAIPEPEPFEVNFADFGGAFGQDQAPTQPPSHHQQTQQQYAPTPNARFSAPATTSSGDGFGAYFGSEFAPGTQFESAAPSVAAGANSNPFAGGQTDVFGFDSGFGSFASNPFEGSATPSTQQANLSNTSASVGESASFGFEDSFSGFTAADSTFYASPNPSPFASPSPSPGPQSNGFESLLGISSSSFAPVMQPSSRSAPQFPAVPPRAVPLLAPDTSNHPHHRRAHSVEPRGARGLPGADATKRIYKTHSETDLHATRSSNSLDGMLAAAMNKL